MFYVTSPSSSDDSPIYLYPHARRHLRLRYEDIATSPELATNLIYCWAGLRAVPPSVLGWIAENTKLPECNTSQYENRRLAAESSLRQQAAYWADRLGTPRGPLTGGHRVLTNPVGVDGDEPAGLAANVTGPVAPGEENGPDSIECDENQKQAANRPYDTKRNSASMVMMWRKQMPENETMAVWEACERSHVMDELGYDI